METTQQKLSSAIYEMNRIAEQLFVSYGLADYSTDLSDSAKSNRER